MKYHFYKSGEKYNRLTLIAPGERNKDGRILWKAICDCGHTIYVDAAKLGSGNTKSCGCLKNEKTSKRFSKHRMRHTKEYDIWCSMRQRCNNPKQAKYYLYGGRGIKVCESWNKSFTAFYSDMGQKPYGMSLDRIDNDKGYSSKNCRWATQTTQAKNTSRSRFVVLDGKRMNVKDAEEILGVGHAICKMVYRHGVTHQEACDHYLSKIGVHS